MNIWLTQMCGMKKKKIIFTSGCRDTQNPYVQLQVRKPYPASELYPIDAFTYRNLYTISLDQLARQPEGISDMEMDKLQSGSFRAGLVDIANIPRLENIFLIMQKVLEAQRAGSPIKP